MAKGTPYSVRLAPEQRQKLAQMAQAAGTDESWIVRRLIDSSRIVSGAVFVGAVTLPEVQGQTPAPETR